MNLDTSFSTQTYRGGKLVLTVTRLVDEQDHSTTFLIQLFTIFDARKVHGQ